MSTAETPAGRDLTLITTAGAVDLMAAVTEGPPDMVRGRAIPTVDVVFASRCRDCGQAERRDSANLWRDSWESISASPHFASTGWGKWAREHPEECPERLRTIARYLTAGGAVVTVTNRHDSSCDGCGQADHSDSEPSAREWAQSHAERCRAMPSDEGDQA
ncbi:hypothetical protein ABZ135_32875 [Streptomyces sp. NPDC006339]|uniref:hypothetical protein n=1 Tax=Streptomyces sp. NPDC006339 TaxID=3156755 RepID=UPI0033B5325B